jgi:hypothetical protein
MTAHPSRAPVCRDDRPYPWIPQALAPLLLSPTPLQSHTAGDGPGVLGGGTGGGPGKRPAAAAAKLPSDFFGGGASGSGSGGGGGGGGGNEAYRVDDGAAATGAAVQHPPDAYAVDAGPSLPPAGYYPATAGPRSTHTAWDGGGGGGGGGGAGQKAGGGGGGGKKPRAADEFELPVELAGVQFKEVSQASLRYVAPGQAAEKSGLASALGSDYANQLRAQAATCKGTGKANQKHQIGTLLHNAKVRVHTWGGSCAALLFGFFCVLSARVRTCVWC